MRIWLIRKIIILKCYTLNWLLKINIYTYFQDRVLVNAAAGCKSLALGSCLSLGSSLENGGSIISCAPQAQVAKAARAGRGPIPWGKTGAGGRRLRPRSPAVRGAPLARQSAGAMLMRSSNESIFNAVSTFAAGQPPAFWQRSMNSIASVQISQPNTIISHALLLNGRTYTYKPDPCAVSGCYAAMPPNGATSR